MCFTNISYFNQQGFFSEACKDSVFYLDNGTTAVYSLADGVNSKKFSKEGAQAIQEEIAMYFLQDPSFLFTSPISWVKLTIIEKIKETLRYLSRETTPASEFASTLLFVAISKTYNKCLWFHIGDGVILKEGNSLDSTVEILSHAHHGITSQYTYTTFHKPLRRYMHCGTENLQHLKKLVLATDGAIHPYYSDYLLSKKGQFLFKKGLSAVYEDLQNHCPKDDYSMLEISFTD